MKKYKVTGNIIFKETQSFRHSWFWLVMAIPMLVIVGVLILVATSADQDKKEAILAMTAALAMVALVFWGFLLARFELVVTDKAVFYRWMPFRKNYSSLYPSDLDRVWVRRRPFFHLGYKRYALGYGRVHNTGASEGLQFRLKSGRRVFIGSYRSTAFRHAVEQLIPVSKK